MKKALYILIAMLIALAIRLYPTLISGMPFSTDAWPLIRNTEQLIQNTPVPLNSNIFDGYNNFWPASQLFGAILSQITNLPAITAMALGIPIAAALTLPLFYLIVKKITQNSKISLIATILLATAFPYTLFTAGVTKETFANPIYFSIILIFLLKHNWKTTLLFTIASITLVLSHHLTAFITIGIITSITIASYIAKPNKDQKNNSNKSNLLLLAILSIMIALYFGLYAYPALTTGTITPSDLLTVAAYQIILIAATLYLIHIAQKESPTVTILKCALCSLVIIIFLFIATQIAILPIAPTIPLRYFLYATPLITAAPLTIFALNKLHQKKFSLLLPLFWFLPAIAFAIYGVFANPPSGLTFAIRSINFILPPLTILIAIGIYKLYKIHNHIKARKLTKIIALITVFSMVALNSYSLYATVSLQEPYLGYFWRYEPSEYRASNWITLNANNQTVAGDSKVNYLLNGYFNENVSVLKGLQYLEGKGTAPQMLYIYNQMYTNGYVLYEGTPITLPTNWTNKLTDYNIIYANSQVTIYAKR